jgi:hypothetical protein
VELQGGNFGQTKSTTCFIKFCAKLRGNDSRFWNVWNKYVYIHICKCIICIICITCIICIICIICIMHACMYVCMYVRTYVRIICVCDYLSSTNVHVWTYRCVFWMLRYIQTAYTWGLQWAPHLCCPEEFPVWHCPHVALVRPAVDCSWRDTRVRGFHVKCSQLWRTPAATKIHAITS